MLWRKTWYETRTQFLLSAAVVAGVCAVIVVFERGTRAAARPPLGYDAYLWNAIYKDYGRNLFALLVIVLGGGTLLQERARATAGFTLGLPVSRARIVAARAATGLAEVGALAAVPALVLPLASSLVGEHYAGDDAARFALLWLVGGAALFALALLVSSVVVNEYAAWCVTFLVVMAYEGVVNFTGLARHPGIDLFRLMNGTALPTFDPVRRVVSALPVASLTGPLVICGGALAATIWVTQRTEY